MGTIGPSSGAARASAQHVSTVSFQINSNIMGGSGISKLDKLQSGNGSNGSSSENDGASSISPFAHLQGPAAAMATHLHNFSTNFGSGSKVSSATQVPPTPPSTPILQAAEQRNHTRSEDESENIKSRVVSSPATTCTVTTVTMTTPSTGKNEIVNGFNNRNNGQCSPSPIKRSAIPPKPPPKPKFIKKSPFVNLPGSRPGSPVTNHTLSPRFIKKDVKNSPAPIKKCKQLPVDANCPKNVEELWLNRQFLERFFFYFNVSERAVLAQICVQWKTAAYQPRLWRGCLPVLKCKALQHSERLKFLESLQQRGLDCVSLYGANDDDVQDLISNCSSVAKYISHVTLKCCSVTDKGLENLLDGMTSVYKLELSGCNEVSEAGLWSALDPRILSLSISDCINVADESLGAIAQLLPSLYEFNLQAYHVTDVALSYFSQKQGSTLNILRLQSCWEISNQGVSNMVHALPNLTILSLAGCSKLTDAGVEVIAENLKKLKCLDLSWCSRITDAALEYIACDLNQLEQLTLDRCIHITDIGVGYISTMLALQTLFLRWCNQMGDFGLQHLCSMRNLQVLSVAGCSLLTVGGLSALVQLRNLRELELTNCPGASSELYDYLRQQLPRCIIFE